MIFENYSSQTNAPGKKVKIVRNGDFSKSCEIRLTASSKFSNIRAQIEDKFGRKFQLNRLFNGEGVEILEDDLEYIKDGSTLYASSGEEFDTNSQFSEYEIIRSIGEGGFGKVVLAVHKHTLEKVAIKFLKTQMIGNASNYNKKDIDMVFRETDILKQLRHENIVKILNQFTLSNMQVVIIMEYLEGGELAQLLKQKGFFEEDEAKIYFKQILNAIAYCHQNRVIHRDLKLENLLLVKKNTNQIKAIDFGISGVQSRMNVDNTDTGSLCYMAPEILQGKAKSITPLIDVWAMGVILYEMLYGRLPFYGGLAKDIIEKIINNDFEIPEKPVISDDCLDCLKKMLDKNPERRITSFDLQYHPWVTKQKKESGQKEESKSQEIEKPIKQVQLEKPKMIQSKQFLSIPTNKNFEPRRSIREARSRENSPKQIRNSYTPSRLKFK